ncbi:MAG: heavy metal translocating P-type ATPase [Candidatus Aminicenantes bacterium]
MPKHKKDHQGHHKHMLKDFQTRFWISLGVTLPVLMLSPMIQSLAGIVWDFPGRMVILLVLSAFVYVYGGWPFLKGLIREARERQPGMMTLIALAITVAFVYSALVVFGVKGKVFFWELVTLIDVMLLGHWIEMRSVMGASRALEELAQLMPSTAHRLASEGETEEVEIQELKAGDKVLIKPGEKIPVDGDILKGDSEVDESMITGESEPVIKQKDDEVIAGSVNGNGSLTVKVSKTGKDSYLNQMIKLVENAQQSKSKAQGFADRAAFWLTVVAVSVGIATLTAWVLSGKTFAFSLERMVTVMVITCPHALGLAIPLVIAVITALSAKNGLLIRNRTAFEEARKIQTVMFDKTGTLTKGEFGVTDVISLSGWPEDKILGAAAAVEKESEHSIAKGIVQEAEEKNIKIPHSSGFESLPGKGARAELENETVLVGNKALLENTEESGSAIEKMEKLAGEGKTTVFVISGGKVRGVIGLTDVIREESRRAVEELKKKGIEVALITGDNKASAEYVAGELGIETWFAGVLPDKKSEKIKQLQEDGKIVAMVGDGINDAPALAQADLGIAIGTGTDVAAETADIILVENNPRDVCHILNFSRITRRKMKQNLAWATGYNVIAIPLAAGVLYHYGILLAPAAGAVVMSLSTVIVAVNARLVSYEKVCG